jgi:hypothetical protein
MTIWYLFYCSSDIVNDPPDETLLRLSKDSPGEAAKIDLKLATLCGLEIQNWPPKWVEKIARNRFQLRAGNFRIYFGVYIKEIIVFHICRKMAQKALRSDLERARLNQEAYEKWMEGKR